MPTISNKYTSVQLMLPKFPLHHLNTLSVSHHLPRLMLTEIYCPILGDQMYMQRVVEIDGVLSLIAPKDVYRVKGIQVCFFFF